MNYSRLYRADDKAADAGEPGTPITFTAATLGTKRDGLDLAGLPWALGNYRANPVVLYSHDYSGRPPIGRAEVTEADGVLTASIVFDQGDAFARDIERKYRDGYMSAVSIGWDDTDAKGVPARASGSKPAAHELLDISAVNVPGDPQALIARQAAAMRAYVAELEAGASEDVTTADVTTVTEADVTADVELTDEILDAIAERVAERMAADDDNAGDVEGEDGGGIAARMVAIMDPSANDPDAERKRKYNALKPAYARLGWTMPEWVDVAELRIMDDDVWRGLFVSGELARAGKELSAANMTELAESIAAIEAGTKRLRSLVDRVAGKGAGEPKAGEAERAFDTDDDPLAALLNEVRLTLNGGN